MKSAFLIFNTVSKEALIKITLFGDLNKTKKRTNIYIRVNHTSHAPAFISANNLITTRKLLDSFFIFFFYGAIFQLLYAFTSSSILLLLLLAYTYEIRFNLA